MVFSWLSKCINDANALGIPIEIMQPFSSYQQQIMAIGEMG